MATDELVAEFPTDPAATRPPAPANLAWTRGSDGLGLYTRAKFALVRTFLWGWARLLSLRGLYLLGVVFGTCEWMVDYRRRRRVGQRLRELLLSDLPSEQTRYTVWRHFVRSRCDKLIYLIFDKLPREKILKRVRFHGQEHLDRALERGKGAVIVLDHSGPHHVALLLMALLGYRVTAIRDRKEGSLRRYVLSRLADSFPEFRAVRWFFSDTYPRELYRWLADGFVLSGALDVSRDRGMRASTTTVRFFGRRQEFINGMMKVALRCGAPVVQGFVLSRRNYYYRLVITKPLVDPNHERQDPAECIDAAMQSYADRIQEHVRRYPCQLSRL